MKDFFAVPGTRSETNTPQASSPLKPDAYVTQAGKPGDGLEHLGDYRGVNINAEHLTLSTSKSSDDRSLHRITCRKSSSALAPGTTTVFNQQRPQTLSHFSLENVKALMWWVRGLNENLLKEYRYLNFFGRTLDDSSPANNLPNMDPQCESIVSFARQSIVYVLSSIPALSLSFPYGIHLDNKGGHLHYASAPFNHIVQSFYWLRKLEGCYPIILSSLSSASEALYSSLPIKRRSRQLSRPTSATILPALRDRNLLEPFHGIKSEREAAHLAHIILAALIATIPACSDVVWQLVHNCHRKGKMAHDTVTDPVTTRSAQLVLDAFEDITALNLLGKLCKALSTRMAVVDSMNRSQTKDFMPDPVRSNETSVVEWILHGLLNGIPDIFAYSKTLEGANVEQIHWKYVYNSSQLSGKRRKNSPTYFLLIIQWLKVLVMKEWNGKPEIDIFGTAGSALEMLRYICKFPSLGRAFALGVSRGIIHIDTLVDCSARHWKDYYSHEDTAS